VIVYHPEGYDEATIVRLRREIAGQWLDGFHNKALMVGQNLKRCSRRSVKGIRSNSSFWGHHDP
jgi:hypothetical protein